MDKRPTQNINVHLRIVLCHCDTYIENEIIWRKETRTIWGNPNTTYFEKKFDQIIILGVCMQLQFGIVRTVVDTSKNDVQFNLKYYICQFFIVPIPITTPTT